MSRLAFLLIAASAAHLIAAEPDYVADVKPLLARRCGECHGAEEHESGLRVDSAAAMKKGGVRGAAIVAKDSRASLLIQAVSGGHDELEMPPGGPPLNAAEVKLLADWIDAGAKAAAEDVAASADPRLGHWSFQPVVRPELPAVRDASWPSSPIDRFIQSRLEAEGISPSAEAERATLIRRLYLDLTGLLPPPGEIERFLADQRPDAYERLVERLLASPHYGERWGRHWLDLARYGDSNGFTIDGERSIWKYRDWVIEAINAGMPLDRFAIEQLAGDMLPDPSLRQRIATGFHRNTLINQEGGTDQEQFRVEAVVDRVNTTGAVFLGLTIGCAQCHDHKFDPLSQREYYELFAFFNNQSEPALDLPSAEQHRRLGEANAALAVAIKELEAFDAAEQPAWEERIAAAGLEDIEWAPLAPVQFSSSAGAEIAALDDGSLLVGPQGKGADTYYISCESSSGATITALRLEALTHDSLPKTGPGRAANGNFVMSALRLSIEGEAVAFTRVTADHEQADFRAAGLIDGDPKTGWAIGGGPGGTNSNKTAVLILERPLSIKKGTRLEFELEHLAYNVDYKIGRFRLSATSGSAELLDLPQAAREALAVPRSQRTTEQAAAATDAFAKLSPGRRPLQVKVDQLKKEQADLKKEIPTTLVLAELSQPRQTHVHIRGDFLHQGQPVTPGVPSVLPPLPPSIESPDRLDLARWLVDADNPLTPRVAVNRWWQRFFGRGLVATENDFGTRGSPPSHPELLDWLASELVRSGWDMKAIHRLIVTSAVYRQSSRGRSDLAEVDPTNRLLARQTRLRLPAETVRDAGLSASGLLSRRVGGESVFPPQPAGLDSFTQNKKNWRESEGGNRYRRGMYTFFWRSSPHPFLMTFDAPDGNSSCTRRVRSNTPLQALTLANDVTFVEFARGLAGRVLAEGGRNDAERIDALFRQCLSRPPTASEQAVLLEFVSARRAEYADDPDAARELSPLPAPGGLSVQEGAAWTALCRVLLNLDEFITRE